MYVVCIYIYIYMYICIYDICIYIYIYIAIDRYSCMDILIYIGRYRYMARYRWYIVGFSYISQLG